jgi:hypothetical protein
LAGRGDKLAVVLIVVYPCVPRLQMQHVKIDVEEGKAPRLRWGGKGELKIEIVEA